MRKSRFTEAQIVGIIQEYAAGAKVMELCRCHGISDATFYKWKAKYGDMQISDVKGLKELEDENGKLKKLYRSLEEMQTDLDHCLMKYNEHRSHSGRHCYGTTPMQTFRETIHVALEKNIPAPDLSDSEALHSAAVR